jgi:hypothetical protein
MSARGVVWLGLAALCVGFWLAVALAAGAAPPWQ